MMLLSQYVQMHTGGGNDVNISYIWSGLMGKANTNPGQGRGALTYVQYTYIGVYFFNLFPLISVPLPMIILP